MSAEAGRISALARKTLARHETIGHRCQVLFVLSPAKKLDFDRERSEFSVSTPELLKETRLLSESTAKLKAKDLAKLMKLSESLAQLNYDRFQSFDSKATRPKGSSQAALAFDGDTYSGLRAFEFSSEEMEFAQIHMGILSGLYGLLRPLDAIQPYRLEMGTRLKNPRGTSLYDFWGDRVAKKIDKRLKAMGSESLINLASNEYFSVIPSGSLRSAVITPVFKEMRSGKAKIVSFSAKRARGTMGRYIVQNRLTDPQELKKFREDGYRFQKQESTETQWLFLRDQPKK